MQFLRNILRAAGSMELMVWWENLSNMRCIEDTVGQFANNR